MDDDFLKLLQDYIDGPAGRELFVFSGSIDAAAVDTMRGEVERLADPQKGASVFLTTFGGDAHAAYRLIECLRSCFRETRLLIAGNCKSAGSLVAVGATELAFGPRGELGPLDVQVRKPDEMYGLSSGLEIFQAVQVVTELVETAFASYVVKLVASGISTRTASEIASNLAGRIFEPIAAQIDPGRLGEAERAMRTALDYGQRLGSEHLQAGGLDRLVREYPSHGSVIDEREAARVFTNVRKMTDQELKIAEHWSVIVGTPATNQPFTFAGRTAYTQNAPASEEGDVHGVTTDSGSSRSEAASGGEPSEAETGVDPNNDASSSDSEEADAPNSQPSA